MTDKKIDRLVGEVISELDEIIDRLTWDRKIVRLLQEGPAMTDKQFGRLVGQTISELDEITDRLKRDRKMLIEIAENKGDSATDKLFNLHVHAMLLTLHAKQATQYLNKRWNAITEILGWDIPDDWKDI